MGVPIIGHSHVPLFRVARAGWTDPLDASFSRAHPGRWNALGDGPVLYLCCSVEVARSVVRDVFQLGSLLFDDLTAATRPVLIEVSWTGELVDMASVDGISQSGFDSDYPNGVEHARTQPLASEWRRTGAEGVVCRSASVLRIEPQAWIGDHESWSEVALFVGQTRNEPVMIGRRNTTDWLT